MRQRFRLRGLTARVFKSVRADLNLPKNASACTVILHAHERLQRSGADDAIRDFLKAGSKQIPPAVLDVHKLALGTE